MKITTFVIKSFMVIGLGVACFLFAVCKPVDLTSEVPDSNIVTIELKETAESSFRFEVIAPDGYIWVTNDEGSHDLKNKKTGQIIILN